MRARLADARFLEDDKKGERRGPLAKLGGIVFQTAGATLRGRCLAVDRRRPILCRML